MAYVDIVPPQAPKYALGAVELQDTRLPGGFRLPNSYREFISRFGYGRLLGLFIVYTADPSQPDSLFSEGEKVRSFVREALQDEYFECEPDGSEALAGALFPFAMSENGEYLAWALSEEDEGEYPIYCLAARMAGTRYAGRDLVEVIDRLTGSGVKEILGTGYSPLPSTFEPFP